MPQVIAVPDRVVGVDLSCLVVPEDDGRHAVLQPVGVY